MNILRIIAILLLAQVVATVPPPPILLQTAATKSQTGVASAILQNQMAGDDILAVVSYCESQCQLPPGNNTVRVSDTLGSYCANIGGAVTNGNQYLTIFRCQNVKAAQKNTVSAYVFLGPNEPTGATLQASISLSEWTPLGTFDPAPTPGEFTFAAGVGTNAGPSNNFMMVNPWNGVIVSEAGPGPAVWQCPPPMASMAVAFK
jgi:hypothetical protein